MEPLKPLLGCHANLYVEFIEQAWCEEDFHHASVATKVALWSEPTFLRLNVVELSCGEREA